MVTLNSFILCWEYKCIWEKNSLSLRTLDSCCHPKEIMKCHWFKFEIKGHFWRHKNNGFLKMSTQKPCLYAYSCDCFEFIFILSYLIIWPFLFFTICPHSLDWSVNCGTVKLVSASIFSLYAFRSKISKGTVKWILVAAFHSSVRLVWPPLESSYLHTYEWDSTTSERMLFRCFVF